MDTRPGGCLLIGNTLTFFLMLFSINCGSKVQKSSCSAACTRNFCVFQSVRCFCVLKQCRHFYVISDWSVMMTDVLCCDFEIFVVLKCLILIGIVEMRWIIKSYHVI